MIKVYSSEEIMAEKIRAIFERTRPRDLYDVWYLHNETDEGKMLSILNKKCKIKGVKIEIHSLEDRKEDFADAWKSSLQHQLKELPEFDHIYNKIVTQMREYKIYIMNKKNNERKEK